MSKTYQGYLLIADITGYTQYLSASELEHAQETLTALLELLVENTRPPLIISRLEGDAVISYGLQDDFIGGQSFIEMIENTYVTFRKALERLVLNNTCRCNACANISTLDLKFFVHYGTFGIQRISTYDELVGSDINLLHRLLKNTVREQIGFHAYALYTDTAIRQLGLEEVKQSMTPHQESYENLDDVDVWVQDLHPVWEAKRSTVEVTLPPERVVETFEVVIDLPREQVWDYMTQPKFRNLLIGSDRMDVTHRSNGRIAAGSVYQCYHGDKPTPQTILEWQPFERMIVREISPLFPEISANNEYRLTSVDGGTKLVKRMSKLSGPLFGRIMLNLLFPAFKRVMRNAFESFKVEIERDYRKRRQAEEKKPSVSAAEIEDAAAASLKAPSEQR